MRELRPGVITEVMAKILAEATVRSQAAMTTTALAIERQAKVNASHGSHNYRTRLPPRPGAGPAIVSGTLVRSITHSQPKVNSGGWEIRVGLAGGLYPWYGKGRTASSKYGMYLEKGMLRNGNAYPFLSPAVKFASSVVIRTAFVAAFSVGWTV